jgi:hypothetical protein
MDVNDPSINKFSENNERWIEVKVTCRVSALPSFKVNFDAKNCSCPSISCITDQFNEGQQYYLYFKSAVDGYLAVFLDVPADNTTYRLLPYQKNNNQGAFFVKADTDYYFFSKENVYANDISSIDELVLSLTEKGIPEDNKIFILFSPNSPIEKPIMSKAAETQAQKNVLEERFEIPVHMPSEKFQEWQLKVRNRKKDIEYKSILINIRPVIK